MPEIKKAKHPTSGYNVLCDYFDVEYAFALHETEEGQVKLNATMKKGSKDLSISLHREDVEAQIAMLESLLPHIDKRW